MLKCKDKIICKNIVHCKNMFSQGRGLMFRDKKAVDNTAWIFHFSRLQRVIITMWFVKFPIDIIFLDDNKKIVEMTKNIMPWMNYKTKKKCKYIIELQSGTINDKKLRLKDKISF